MEENKEDLMDYNTTNNTMNAGALSFEDILTMYHFNDNNNNNNYNNSPSPPIPTTSSPTIGNNKNI